MTQCLHIVILEVCLETVVFQSVQKMVYQQDGVKIAFYKFPEDRELFRKWIVATCTWRDIGKEFRVTDSKRVCLLDT